MNLNYIFRCKKCGFSLFRKDQLLLHKLKKEPDIVNNNSFNDDNCTSLFISQVSWMENFTEQQGKIFCPNKNCDTKLGYYCWFGAKCSCGFWQTPAFQIHKSKVDYLPESKKCINLEINTVE